MSPNTRKASTKKTPKNSKEAKSPKPSGNNVKSHDPINPRRKSAVSGPALAPTIPLELQQLLLNIFRDSLQPTDPESWPTVLQEVKQHLYNRDFTQAFGKAEYLEAYARRWSPSRALAYLQILLEISTLEPKFQEAGDLPSNSLLRGSLLKATLIGGGAGAELVAIAGYLQRIGDSPESAERKKALLTVIDIADWADVLKVLENSITSPPLVSKYASDAVKAANSSLIAPDALVTHFLRENILEVSELDLAQIVEGSQLVTLLFTLNELFSTSLSSTTKFLIALGKVMQSGSLLLVVDSSGSYSTIRVGDDDKRHPMKWLLELTMMESTGENGMESKIWEKLVSHDSQWYRRPDGLRYPIELEDMRYQIHLYRKL